MSFSFLLPILLTVGGTYMLLKLKLFFIRHPVNTFKCIKRALRDGQTKKSFYLALAGTLGIGNIVGVAVGIAVGGAGSVFWILVSSVFACVLKYSESALSVLYSDEDKKGIPAAIKGVFGKRGRILSSLYCIFALLLAFVMGGALQSSGLAALSEFSTGIPKVYVGIFITVLVVIISRNNNSFIKRCTGILVPLATVLYVFLTFLVIARNFSSLGTVFFNICTCAFSSQGLVGGLVGFLCSHALREGFSRGLLSNEAGAGTSCLAQSEGAELPHVAGLLGMLEVILDTVILCTLTGVSILVSMPKDAPQGGIMLLFESIGDEFGAFSMSVLLFCVATFSFSTCLCWMYYGRSYERMLLGKEFVFDLLFIVSVFIGALTDELSIVRASDCILFFLSVITLCAVIKGSDRIRDLSEQGNNLNLYPGRTSLPRRK